MKTACPKCGQHFEIEQENIGCTAQCSSCGTDFVVQALQENQTLSFSQSTMQNKNTIPSTPQPPSAFVEQPTSHMKPLTCEMCGSTNIMKQDGVFVCQSCGTKYSVEEAKKMMIAGTVNVAGTVTVDNSAFVKKYLSNARRALDKDDWEEVEKYYNMVEQNSPNNIEAVFFSSFGKAMLSLTDTEYFKREQKFNVLNKSISVINDYYEVTSEDKEAVLRKICNAVEHMYSVQYVFNPNAVGTVVGSKKWCKNLLKSVKEAVIIELKQIQEVHKDENYIQELIDKLSNLAFAGACYIATSVYGSYDCPQVWTLRRYRDNNLASNLLGRVFIHIYYAVSPTLVRLFGKSDWFKSFWKKRLDKMVYKLKSEGISDTPYRDRIW